MQKCEIYIFINDGSWSNESTTFWMYCLAFQSQMSAKPEMTEELQVGSSSLEPEGIDANEPLYRHRAIAY